LRYVILFFERTANRLILAVKTFKRGGHFSFFTIECDVKTFGHESFSDIFEALSCAEKGVGDVLVFPVGPLASALIWMLAPRTFCEEPLSFLLF